MITHRIHNISSQWTMYLQANLCFVFGSFYKWK